MYMLAVRPTEQLSGMRQESAWPWAIETDSEIRSETSSDWATELVLKTAYQQVTKLATATVRVWTDL